MSKKFNIRSVNRALEEAGIVGELVRGDGYFYFAGPSFLYSNAESVYVYHLNELSIERWVEEAFARLPEEINA